jgi:sRNA-binding protein
VHDPEKAKYLEENLAAIPDCVKSLNNYVKMAPGSPVVTYATYKIDENGNISIMSGSTNDPDGKIAKENAERKAQEKKAAEEKAAKKRAEKKAAEEKAAEERAEKRAAEEVRIESGEYTISATGTDVKAVTQSVVSAALGTSAPMGVSFDVKA